MGVKLLKYYKLINSKIGMKGKMALAIETKIPSTRASFEEDSEDNIKIFKRAYKKLTGEEAPDFD